MGKIIINDCSWVSKAHYVCLWFFCQQKFQFIISKLRTELCFVLTEQFNFERSLKSQNWHFGALWDQNLQIYIWWEPKSTHQGCCLSNLTFTHLMMWLWTALRDYQFWWFKNLLYTSHHVVFNSWLLPLTVDLVNEIVSLIITWIILYNWICNRKFLILDSYLLTKEMWEQLPCLFSSILIQQKSTCWVDKEKYRTSVHGRMDNTYNQGQLTEAVQLKKTKPCYLGKWSFVRSYMTFHY